MIISLPMPIHYLVFVHSYFGFLYCALCSRAYIDSTISLVVAKIREKQLNTNFVLFLFKKQFNPAKLLLIQSSKQNIKHKGFLHIQIIDKRRDKKIMTLVL